MIDHWIYRRSFNLEALNKAISIYLTTLILTVALLAPNSARESQNPVKSISEDPAQYVLEAPKTPFLSMGDYAAAVAQNAAINPGKFQRLIECESLWQEDAAGDNGTSFGLLQFKTPTFAHFTKKYGIADADIENPHHQIDLAAKMIANGHLSHWKNCARKIGWI